LAQAPAAAVTNFEEGAFFVAAVEAYRLQWQWFAVVFVGGGCYHQFCVPWPRSVYRFKRENALIVGSIQATECFFF
jgi:hypothetical protein